MAEFKVWESGYLDKQNKKVEQEIEKSAIRAAKRVVRTLSDYNSDNKRVGKFVVMHSGTGLSAIFFVRSEDSIECMLNVPMSSYYKTCENGRLRYNVKWDGTIHVLSLKFKDTIKFTGFRPDKGMRKDA